MTKAARLSIFLLKESQSYKNAVQVKASSPIVCSGLGPGSRLYMHQSQETVPKWLEFLRPLAPSIGVDLRSTSASALLLVPVKARIFALAFGHGKSLLKPSTWEENFGLRVTLNSVDPKTLKSIDRKELDPLTRHSRVNASRSGELAAFGFDPGQDMLRAVTGTPTDEALGTRMSGMDSLVVNVAIQPDGLGKLLEDYLVQFESDGYQSTFPQVDNVREVRDRELTEVLDEKMVAKIRAKNLETTWLAISAPIDWTQVSSFTYRKEAQDDPVDDVHLDSFLGTLRNPQSLSPRLLLSRRIWALGRDGDLTGESWRVYDCIYSEVEHDNEHYLLTDGHWYKVASDYALEVNQFVKSISQSPTLPDYNHKDEAAYNKFVAANDSAYISLDGKLIAHGGGKSRIEFCDLLSKSGRIVHVKRYGGSSALSHLFAQGVVSTLTFLGDASFRTKVEQKIPSAHLAWTAGGNPNPTKLTLVYAVVAKSAKDIEHCLPFFSKVAVFSAAGQLRATRINIALEKIRKT